MKKRQMSIRSILQQEIDRRGFNLSQFSRISGINRGTLSQVLNGNPPQLPSIADLDRLAIVTEYNREQIYALYIEDCFREEALHGKRLKNVLYRCVELNLTRLMQELMQRLLAYSSQSKGVYDMAEQWYDEGHRQTLIPLYEYVTISEKYRNSDRISISRYRIFQLSQTNNFEHNLHAAITFEPYRSELPIGYRLDGLLKLANIYFNQHLWKKVEQFADELRELATSAYEHRLHMQENVDGERGLETERHLVVYYGQGYVMKGSALEEQKNYTEALDYISGYENLSWFEGLDEIGMQEVEKLARFAKANFLNLNILLGNTSKLEEYTEFLKDHPMEILPGLLSIVESANRYKFNIDHIIEEFSKEIQELNVDENHYQYVFSIDRYINLHKKVAVYFLRNVQYNNAITSILKSLKLSAKVENKNVFVDCVALFELNKEYATKKQLSEYRKIMEEVLKVEEDYSDLPFIARS